LASWNDWNDWNESNPASISNPLRHARTCQLIAKATFQTHGKRRALPASNRSMRWSCQVDMGTGQRLEKFAKDHAGSWGG
jgi:hypothetical protein